MLSPKVGKEYSLKKGKLRDFPGGPVVKNPPYNGGDMGLIPGQGTKIPHAAGQLSPRATTTHMPQLEPVCHKLQSPCALEPAHHNYRAHTPWSLYATTREEKTRMPQLERSPRTTTKSPCTATKDPAYLNEDPACRN